MSAIPAVSPAPAPAPDPSASDSTTRTPVKTLGQDDFLKLLVAQMSSQDPLNPQKDTDFIAQMAQFSTLEQSRTMGQDVAALRSQQDFSQAYSLIGQSVSLQVDKDTTAQGTVDAVTITAGKPQIVVNGTGYDLSQVLSVTPPAPQVPNP
ncbi:MAG TPA: flagellar hook capping FlgD N-terminal domain-containing protein [Candidatus Limnocylindria bacterium]|jgi:flagellar basal-body rod modification protein FlgD|nr:flagellar hook capping FlgD N-terminal domain-containing protein [Candidatus Limnocylindria bacterium]